jgi:DNA end-binding protein Ku
VYLDRPYYLAPVNKGAKVYALLREILAKNQKAGIAKVVIHTRQHLAVVMACGRALILNLMRWEDELRSTEDLNLPEKGVKANNLSAKEIEMAEQLVENMTGNWQPQNFTDSFREQILQLVKEKYEAGDTHAVAGAEALEDEAPSAKIYDLTEMLQRSLNKDGARPGKSTEEETPTPRKASKQPAAKTQSKADKPAKKQPARKSPARKASTNTSAAAPRKTAKTATKPPGKAAKQPAAKGPAKTSVKKTAAQKTAAQNTTAKKTAAKKTAAKPGSTQHKSRAKAA